MPAAASKTRDFRSLALFSGEVRGRKLPPTLFLEVSNFEQLLRIQSYSIPLVTAQQWTGSNVV
jgi:hypothetical protein